MTVESRRLEKLVKEVSEEVSLEQYRIFVRRIERFLEKYKEASEKGR